MSSHRSRLPRLLACSAVLVSLFLNACSDASNALPTISSAHQPALVAPMALAAPMASRCSQTPESAPLPGKSALGSLIRTQSSDGSTSTGGICTVFWGGTPSSPPSTPAPSSGSGGGGGTGGTSGGFGGTPIIGGGIPPLPPSPPCYPTCVPQPPHLGGGSAGTPGERFAALVAAARTAVGSNNVSFLSGAAADAEILAQRPDYATPMFDSAYGAAETTADSALQSAFTGSQMLVRLSNDEGAAGTGNFLTTIGSLQNVDGSMMTADEAASATGLGYIPTYVGINMQLPTGAQALLGITSGGNTSAIAGSVGGADQIWVSEAAGAEGDAAIAGGTAVISWGTFVELAPLLLLDAPRGGTRP